MCGYAVSVGHYAVREKAANNYYTMTTGQIYYFDVVEYQEKHLSSMSLIQMQSLYGSRCTWRFVIRKEKFLTRMKLICLYPTRITII